MAAVLSFGSALLRADKAAAAFRPRRLFLLRSAAEPGASIRLSAGKKAEKSVRH
jgi:hypothetical protein